MLSCAPPKPCDPRTNMNRTSLIHSDYYAQALSSSSFNRIVIDTNASSTVDLHDFTPPKVLASSGKLAEKQEENVGEYLNLLHFSIFKNFFKLQFFDKNLDVFDFLCSGGRWKLWIRSYLRLFCHLHLPMFFSYA